MPRDWTRNSPSRITHVSGTARSSNRGSSTPMPSTALSTEIAGVSAPSPYSSPAPIRISTAGRVALPLAVLRRKSGSSASRARMPPSPWLSARMMNVRYLMVTTSVNAQKTREAIPRTVSASRVSPGAARDSFIAYSGEVPMSPNTTPVAPTTRANVPPRCGWPDSPAEPMLAMARPYCRGHRPGRRATGIPCRRTALRTRTTVSRWDHRGGRGGQHGGAGHHGVAGRGGAARGPPRGTG